MQSEYTKKVIQFERAAWERLKGADAAHSSARDEWSRLDDIKRACENYDKEADLLTVDPSEEARAHGTCS